MPDQQTKALSLKAAYEFASERGLAEDVTRIRGMAIDGFAKTSSVRRGYIAELFRDKGLLDEFIDRCWSFGRTDEGTNKLRWYAGLHARHQQLLEGADELDGNTEEALESAEETAQTFALESHLRDFLAKNLGAVEPGLRLYSANGRTGVEFTIDNGRIDVLAVDRHGRYVVIELKLSRGRNRALGQLLYYMGWVDKHLGSGPCRGIIVAADISDELRLAVQRIPDVTLARYQVSMSILPVGAPEV